jgi:hypothetical protein
MLPAVETGDDHVPTTEEIYASQIPLEAQTKEGIEQEIRQHDRSDFVEQAAIYPTEREEYDLDGEDGGHHVDGIPLGHENDEVVDETDPRDTEVASWGNEEPAVLQSLPALGTEPKLQENLDDERQSLILPQAMPPVLREESNEMTSGSHEYSPSRKKDPVASTYVAETADQIDTDESTGGNETDNEDNDMDLESTVVPAVTSDWALKGVEHAESFAKGPFDSTAPNSELDIPQDANLSDDREAFEMVPQPIQPASTSTTPKQYSATYGQETGYLGDDEMLPDTEATGASSRATATKTDVLSEDKVTQAVQPEDESLRPMSDHQEVDLDVTSEASHAFEPAPAMISYDDLDAAPEDNRSGITLLTDENVAHLPGPTEATGGAFQRSDAGIENASNESVVDVDMGHEAPLDRLVSALRAVPESREEESSDFSPANGDKARSSLAEDFASAAGPNMEGDGSSVSPFDEHDEQSAPAGVIAPVEATSPEAEDIFDVSNAEDNEQQDQAVINDVIFTTVRALPVANFVPEALEPHLPIDILDPALALQPAVLHEHQYRSTEHSDHAAEMAHAERENHLHAFEEVAQAIREDASSDRADTEHSDTAQQSNMTLTDAESRSASPSQSDAIEDSDASPATPQDIETLRPSQQASCIHPEVEQEEFPRATAGNDGNQRDEIGEDQDNNEDPTEITDLRSTRSDSGVYAVESPITAGPTAETPVLETEEQDGQAEAERGSIDEDPADGVEISIVRVHEYPKATRAPQSAMIEPELGSADLCENETDQTPQAVSPTTLVNIDDNIGSRMLSPVVGPVKAHPRIQDSVPAPYIPMETPGYASRENDPPRTPSPRPAEPEVAVASVDVRHHHHGSGTRPTRPISHLMTNTESPASHTRSHCVYHKMEFDEGVHSHTLLIPGCSLGTAEQRSDAGARDLGEASNEEMKLKQDLLFGENFTQQMRSEEEGTLPSDLEHRLSLIVGREIIREGHCYILPLAPGVPHAHPHEADTGEAEEEDGGIASRTRRRTSRTPGPTSGTAPVTPARDGQKRRRSRGPSASRTPASSSKRKMPDLSNVEEAGEEADDGTRDAVHDEQETERSKKKRIIDVDGSPQAVETTPHERSRDDEDGDRMDLDERVDAEHTPVVESAGTRKGWFGWLWGKS